MLIHFNIWDDYDEDRESTVGIIESYGDLREHEIPANELEAIVKLVYEYIRDNLNLPGVEMDCADRLEFFNLSYAKLDQLVVDLDNSNLHYNNNKINFYSES